MQPPHGGRVNPWLAASIDAAARAAAISSIWRSRRRLISKSANAPSISRDALPPAVMVSHRPLGRGSAIPVPSARVRWRAGPSLTALTSQSHERQRDARGGLKMGGCGCAQPSRGDQPPRRSTRRRCIGSPYQCAILGALKPRGEPKASGWNHLETPAAACVTSYPFARPSLLRRSPASRPLRGFQTNFLQVCRWWLGGVQPS